MANEKLMEIIDFAIEKELEAAKFYKDLQKIVKFDSSRNMLRDFELMEEGHAEKLRNYKHEGIEKFNPSKSIDLKIGDYMVMPEQSGELLYQDVLVLAMKKEEAAKNLYLKLADNSIDINVKNLFLKLAEEEARHKSLLETMYDEEILT
jgi:rubrerythrin